MLVFLPIPQTATTAGSFQSWEEEWVKDHGTDVNAVSFNANKLLLTLDTIIEVMEKHLRSDGEEGLDMTTILAAAHGVLELAS